MTEVYEGPAIRALFGQLVKDFGGQEAAAALLGYEKGRISRQISGALPIYPEHFCKLEDAVGRFPISVLLHSRIAQTNEKSNLEKLAEAAMKEHSDVPQAIFAALMHGDFSKLAKEGPECIDALQRLIDAARAEDPQS